MDDTNDKQDVAPENNEDTTGEQKETEAPQPTEREKELEAEVAKYKRIAERNAKKVEKKETPTKVETEPGDLDYGAKAYLRAEGIDPTEFDFVKEQMEESGIKDLDKLVQNPYFKSILQERRDKVAIEKATPTGTRGASENQKSKADYWISRNELPPNTPEYQALRREVVNKRYEMSKSSTGLRP